MQRLSFNSGKRYTKPEKSYIIYTFKISRLPSPKYQAKMKGASKTGFKCVNDVTLTENCVTLLGFIETTFRTKSINKIITSLPAAIVNRPANSV
jgi:hypothetical protein